TVKLTRGGSSFTLPAVVVVSDAPLTVTGQPLTGVSGTALNNALVATFTDGNPFSTAGDFLAEIYWGDGTRSPATTPKPGPGFTVQGSHPYRPAGTFTVVVNVLDATSVNTTIATTSASITGAVAASVLPLVATAGAATGNVPVASFTATTQGP